jgi:RNase P subunit RPR2
MEGYCVKCRSKRAMKNPKEITMKNKKPATTGTCSSCGTKMFKIGKSK